MIWPFLFSNFLLVLVDGSGWKEGKEEEQTSQRWRIVSPATAGEKSVSFYQTLFRCSDAPGKLRGWFNWSQIVKICKNENFGFGIGPCVKPSSRNCTTEWLAPIVQPFREQRYNNKNLFQHNDTTTRTFSSTIIQQPASLADKSNPYGLVGIYLECTLVWMWLISTAYIKTQTVH